MIAAPPVRPVGVHASVVFDGDLVGSSAKGGTPSDWLKDLADEINSGHADQVEADFGRTKGDEIQGRLRLGPNTDPIGVYLEAALRPGINRMRWAIVVGEVHDLPGPAVEGEGPAYERAASLLAEMKKAGHMLRIETGTTRLDERLLLFAPWIARWIEGLTDTQRAIVSARIKNPEARQLDIARMSAIPSDRSLVSRVLGNNDNRDMLKLITFVRTDIAGALLDAQ